MIKRNSNYCLSFFRVFILFYFFLIQRIEGQNAKTKTAKINLKLSFSMTVVGLAKPCLKQKEGIRQLDCRFAFAFAFAFPMVYKSNPLKIGSINQCSR